MSKYDGLDKNQILEECVGTADPNSPTAERDLAAVTVRCTEDIEKVLKSVTDQIKESSESSDRLGNKILWLNRVIFFASLVMAAATIVIAIKT